MTSKSIPIPNVVSLESVVISLGLPYPHNLELALGMEEEVRAGGSNPRTLGILEGQLIGGLDKDQIRFLATAKGIHKISRRNLSLARARQWHGATTVAASLWMSRFFGYEVFATGGIGGVHRGNEMDISADLPELARTPVLTFCAGAKSILNLPATLEFLETWGVPVVGLGTDEFPGFFYRNTGLAVDITCDTVEEVSNLWRIHREMPDPTGMLVTVPVPEHDELPKAEVETAIEAALLAAEAKGLRSASVTPFVLGRVSEETAGRSLQTNLALLRNNARAAAACAVALSQM